MAEAVLFDLGGVVIDWNPRHLFSKIISDQKRLDYFLDTVCPLEWNEIQDAGRSLEVATRERIEQFPEWRAEIAAYYQRWVEMVAGPVPGTADIVLKLARSGKRLFALSNWSRETFPLIVDRFPILSEFEKVFLSADFGMAKPDPRFYEAAVKGVELDRSALLFIDDNVRNVAAATKLRIPSVRFINAEQLERDLRKLLVL